MRDLNRSRIIEFRKSNEDVRNNIFIYFREAYFVSRMSTKSITCLFNVPEKHAIYKRHGSYK